MTVLENMTRLNNPMMDLSTTNIQYWGAKPERMKATPSIAPDTRSIGFLPNLQKIMQFESKLFIPKSGFPATKIALKFMA